MNLVELKSTLFDLQKEAQKAFKNVKTLEDLEQFSQKFIGKKSRISGLLKNLKDLSSEEKKEFAPQVQTLKKNLDQQFITKRNQLETEALNEKLRADWMDVTKSSVQPKGALHPISQIQRRIEQIFSSMGFEVVDGPEVDTEWNCFDALNIPPTHPARDMQDTFFITNASDNTHENSVLRTHTSTLQIRSLIKDGVPVRVIAPGRVFRNEEIDPTHDATFYQVEGMLIDKHINLGHLKGILEKMLAELFEKEIKIRIRPGYFPFVEPGLEIDIWWEYTDKNGKECAKWLEFLGAGMTHPNVLKNCGVDPHEYAGFAFGFGLTRLVMMKYGIEDIRLLSSPKKEFLEQF